MEELLPCPFCNSGQTRIDEAVMWTGQRNIMVSATVIHWCPRQEGQPQSIIKITGADRESAINLWNRRHGNRPN